MLKKLMITTALSGLMMGGAFAQSAPKPMDSPAAKPTPPAATAPADTKPDTAKSDAIKSDAAKSTAAPAASSSAQFISIQKPDQFLASKFKGTDVVSADNEKIGDVSDILFDKTGKIEAFVVSVGGFLGMGAKDVALAPASFQVVSGDKSKNESDKLKLSTMTKDQLKQAANFEPYKEPRATTGMGGSPRPGPASSAPAPRGQ